MREKAADILQKNNMHTNYMILINFKKILVIKSQIESIVNQSKIFPDGLSLVNAVRFN